MSRYLDPDWGSNLHFTESQGALDDSQPWASMFNAFGVTEENTMMSP